MHILAPSSGVSGCDVVGTALEGPGVLAWPPLWAYCLSFLPFPSLFSPSSLPPVCSAAVLGAGVTVREAWSGFGFCLAPSTGALHGLTQPEPPGPTVYSGLCGLVWGDGDRENHVGGQSSAQLGLPAVVSD